MYQNSFMQLERNILQPHFIWDYFFIWRQTEFCASVFFQKPICFNYLLTCIIWFAINRICTNCKQTNKFLWVARLHIFLERLLKTVFNTSSVHKNCTLKLIYALLLFINNEKLHMYHPKSCFIWIKTTD